MIKSGRILATLFFLALLCSCDTEASRRANDMAHRELMLERKKMELQIEQAELAIRKAECLRDLSSAERKQFNDIYYQRTEEYRHDAELSSLEQRLDECYAELDKILKQIE